MTTELDALLASLNPAQRAAVTAPPGPHVVLAGAGSGKTRTLIYRVAYVVATGTPPESILLLTFTRRAAQEMLRRAAGLMDPRCARVVGGTFHAFANRVLRRHARRLGYGEGFTVLDRSDAADVIAAVRAEGGYGGRGKRFPKKEVLRDLFSMAVNTGKDMETLVTARYPRFADDVAEIEEVGEAYAARKKTQHVMDYDDLLVNLRDLLSEHEVVRRELGSMFRLVLVDEYQDTNRLQAHIAALLASQHGNLMVVGDDAQSIYAFRGAEVRNILDFPKLFPGTTTTVLEQSYRSTQPILDLGSAILASSLELTPKRLFTEIDGGEKPRLIRVEDDYVQARWVAEQVLAYREEGVALDEMAVLVRAAWHTAELEIELQNRNIPFRKFGGLRFVEAAHVKDVVALLRLLVNRTDATAWFRVLQWLEGIGPKTAQRLTNTIVEAEGELDALARAVSRARYKEPVAALTATLDRLAQNGHGVTGQLDGVIDYYRPILGRTYDDASRRIRDLEALQVIAERYDALEPFLTDLAIDPPELTRQDGDDDDDELLTLSTVHSAKGLEWHTVFVLNLNNGQFPSSQSLGDPASLEEERRLFYVAVTRAKRRLLLTRPETLPRRGFGRDVAEPSPLLTDIAGWARLIHEERAAFKSETTTPSGNGNGNGHSPFLANIQDYFGNN
ncbi:MAG: ATP-dependent helicase [Acidobacteriota bacterium]